MSGANPTGNYEVKSATDADAADAANAKAIADLTKRVATLEAGGTKPPIPPTHTTSPDGSKMPPLTMLTDLNLIDWTLVGDKLARGNPPVIDPLTSGVVLAETVNHGVIRQTNAAGNQYDYTPTASYPWTAVPKPPVPLPPGSAFTVSPSGFKDPSGNPWRMRGSNGSSRDALECFGNIFNQFPGFSCFRLTSGASEADAAIADTVSKYTGKGVVVLIEDHSGTRRDLTWYTKIATAYKGNPRVMIGVPNEPGGDVSNDQIAVINTIKSAGFTGLIGLQCKGGYDYSSIDPVLKACGKDQLFLTPHIYYAGNDPNGGQQYIDNDINGAITRGLWCTFTEFGDAMDGWHRDQYGLKLVSSVIAAEKGGRCGALFWALDNDNHPDGTCSAFLTRDGSQLTPVGVDPIKPWQVT